MGRVYRARHIRVSRRFAIKVLFGEHATDPKMRERFAREAESASRLAHPNVISVSDFGETDEGLLFLVMDYVEGPELSEILDEAAPLETERALALIRQLALGLDHAHGEGLVHRDFKPENVIVTNRNGVEIPRIVDFGIAVARDPEASDRITTEGIIMGTPAYMSPEQASGKALDGRSDLFGLGVMLYTMLAGVAPFEGSGIAIARQNLTKDPPPFAERVPGLRVDPDLEEIVCWLMARRRDDRCPSAAALVAALDKLAGAGRGGRATVPGPGRRSAPAPATVRRRAVALWLAAGAAAAVALGIAAATLGSGEGRGSAVATDAAVAAPTEPNEATEPELAAVAAVAADAAVEMPPPATPADAAAAPGPEPTVAPERRRRIGRPAATGGERKRATSAAPPPAPVTEASLTALYVRVGERIEAVAAERGEAAVAPLRDRYSRIPFSDALRKPGIRGEVEIALENLSRAVARAARRNP
jgi:serine/threonine-protein kinase